MSALSAPIVYGQRPIAEAHPARGGVVFLVLPRDLLTIRRVDGSHDVELDNEIALELASQLVRAVAESERTRRELGEVSR